MKICSICQKISGSDDDHLDCLQKRSVELENLDFKSKISEQLELSNSSIDLGVEVKAILEHLAKNKDEKL
ncbi:MAG TPA: hypothetical protein VMW55_00720 [Nitrosopumilaceae archaeon]|nr:hypothetical protein [Nitrosopumilaceae archaeon]